MQTAIDTAARTVMERCDLLATFSEELDTTTRRFATSPMHQVHEVIGSWLRDIGMTVEIDAIGNLIGRYDCRGSDRGKPCPYDYHPHGYHPHDYHPHDYQPHDYHLRTSLLGSHLD